MVRIVWLEMNMQGDDEGRRAVTLSLFGTLDHWRWARMKGGSVMMASWALLTNLNLVRDFTGN